VGLVNNDYNDNRKQLTVKRQISNTDRIHEESGEVGDVLPLGLDERRISVEDDVTQTMSKKRTGSERSDEVDKSDLV